tara:strand:+ start:1254 stop:1793 length:540 start_codon:yes stop_codon:yes gene_type:complete
MISFNPTRVPNTISIPKETQRNGAQEAFSDPDYFTGILFRRVIAYLVDVIIIAVLATSIAVIAFVPVVLTLGMLKPFVVGVIALVPIAYHTLMIGSDRPATLGMRLMGIEVRKLSGAKLGHGVALIQTILFYVTTSLTTWLILLVTFFNSKHRTLHDLFCGTMVIIVTRRSSNGSDSQA